MANSRTDGGAPDRITVHLIALAASLLFVSFLAAPSALARKDSAGTGDYSGDWIRSTQVQNFIVYLSITTSSDTEISVHAWGRCKRKPEEGGTRADCEDWGTARATLTASGTATLFQPVQRETWDMSLSDDRGRLWVRVPNSDVAWAREPGVDLVRHSPPQAEPPPPPPDPPGPQTCSIVGKLSGRLEGLSHPDHPGPATKVRLRHMVLSTPERETRTAAVTKGAEYTFKDLPAGVVYRVFPAFFTSQPKHREISCRAGQRHRANFKIIGPAPEG